ncbi:hypothetical protein [Luteococcus sp.]|uniref:hypothetical protein n=1 Tax=Luteococcus sp. TaxID=1969402 RepID=UPI0037369FF4
MANTSTEHHCESSPRQIILGRLGQGRGYALRSQLLARMQDSPLREVGAADDDPRFTDVARCAVR